MRIKKFIYLKKSITNHEIFATTDKELAKYCLANGWKRITEKTYKKLDSPLIGDHKRAVHP